MWECFTLHVYSKIASPPSSRSISSTSSDHVRLDVDNISRGLRTVRFLHRVVVIPPSEEVKEEGSPTTNTQPDESAHEDEGVQHRQRSPQQAKRRRGALKVALLLAILCSTFIGFIIGVIAWANNNPRDMCKKAPDLATFFNYLPAATLLISPAIAVGVFWVGIAYLASRRYAIKPRLWWTDVIIVLNMAQVMLVTAYFMPERFLDGTWDGHVDCAAF